MALLANHAAAAAQPPSTHSQTCWDGSVIPAQLRCAPPAIDPFVIFFDWDSAEITPEAARILDNVARVYRLRGPYLLPMSGHSDRSGSEAYNRELSRRRLESVRNYLVQKGIPAQAIRGEAMGEARPLVNTPDGVREPQNRFVAIAALVPGE